MDYEYENPRKRLENNSLFYPAIFGLKSLNYLIDKVLIICPRLKSGHLKIRLIFNHS